MPISQNWNIEGVVGDHQPLAVKGKGDNRIQTTIGSNVHYGILQDVPYVPSIGVYLFSISKATDRGITVVFKKESVHMYRGVSF